MLKKTCIGLAVAAMSVSTGVVAQSEGEALRLEEILVTARKRKESVQDVPLSIVPFQSEDLLRRDIQNMDDIATNTIGLSYNSGTTSGIQGVAIIRGLATNFVQDRFQNVGIYLDGVYLQRQSMMNLGMIDLARVEVVKGPQNALYGRNAFAGAINYITEKPTQELEGYAQATFGSDEREDYRFSLSGPIIPDLLYGRVAYGTSEFDGSIENDHPFADANVPGDSNEGNMGGWDDETYNIGLIFAPMDTLEMGLSYYDTDLRREFQPNYILTGLAEVASFGTSQYSDMNFNEKTVTNVGVPLPVTGNTFWKGSLPYEPGLGTYISPFGDAVEDTRIASASDPRAFGTSAQSDIITFTVDWDINENWNLTYLFGDIDNHADTAGPAGRDVLIGSIYSDLTSTINSSDFSSRPISDLSTTSHELRVDWNGGEKLFIAGGLFYSDTDDEQYDLTVFAPVCSDRDLNGNGSAADEAANCNLAVVPGVESPLSDAVNNGILTFFDDFWNGERSNWSTFNDEVYAAFIEASYDVTDNVVVRVEARYTEEKKEVTRLTDNFALAPGEVGIGDGNIIDVEFESEIVVPEDDETFDYFAPRLSVDWSWSDQSMVYGYVAKGVKSGGFNNTADVSQLTYDIEEAWTYELGSKNVFFDGKLLLNGALFYVDWSDLQGSEAPSTASQNSNVVVGNIGDATNFGIEVEGTWRFNNAWSVDLGYTWINPEYDDDTDFDAAQRYYYFECELDVIPDDTLCGNTDVSGNQLARTSKQQAVYALNFDDEVFDGWSVNARISGSYQSKQYLTPLNSAYLESRTLYNGNIGVMSPDGHWELDLWGKNLADKKYLGSAFTLALFNKFLVAKGGGRTWGATVKYNL